MPVDAQYYFTPFPLLGVQVGHEYVTTLKIYENHGPDAIQHVGLAFGLDKQQVFGTSEVIIELDRIFHGEEFTISVTDPHNILEDNVSAETRYGPCLEIEDETADACLIVDIHHTFREPLPYKMIGTYIWDFHKNGWQNYFNHGIQIMGESLNPPKTITLTENHEQFVLTLQNIEGTTALDQHGNTWIYDGTYSSWKQESITNIQKHDTEVSSHGLDRNDSRFEIYKDGQALLAQHVLDYYIMDGKQITSLCHADMNHESCKETHFYLTPYNARVDRADNLELQKSLLIEQQRAQEIIDKEKYPYQK